MEKEPEVKNGAHILRRFEQAKTARAPYEPRWQEIAERILPRHGGAFFQNTMQAKGHNKNRRMLDVSGAKALERFGAIMEGMLTPRMQRWHRLRVSNKDLNKVRRVQLYFDEVTDILFSERYAARSNFATAQYENYVSIGAFGTGIKFVEKPREKHQKGIRYRVMPLSGCYLLENYHGLIDTNFRPIDLNARQCVQAFSGEGDRLPDVVKKELEKTGGPDENRTFQFVHCVHPRADFDPDRIDINGTEFQSTYVSVDDKGIVRDDGYATFPFPIGRYFTAPGETYGRGPGDLALGSLKTINAMKVTMVEHGQRQVAPVFLSHDDGVADTFNYTPGFVNPGGLDSEGRELIKPMPVGNLAVGKDMMAAERKDIDDIFLSSLFQILVDKPEMTAEQFIGLLQEKGQLLAPAMGRQQTEDLGPCIERELDILAEQGMLPDMPGELREARGEYKVEYDSPLARAQKAEGISGFMRTTQFLLGVATATKNPSLLDRLDFDAATPEIAEAQAVPPGWIRSDEALEALRQKGQDAIDTQTAIQAGPAAASVLKALPQGAAPQGAAVPGG